MNRASAAMIKGFMRFGPALLPFADAATRELPMSRLLRLSLFQITVGMAAVLLIGTLNRVMIVELNVPSSIVAIMLALPLLFAPLRALVGFRSDTHRSYLGWRRVPFIWMGTMLQFGGLAPADCRPNWRRTRLSLSWCRAAYGTNCGSGIGHRFSARTGAPSRGRIALRNVAFGHGSERTDLWICA